MDINILTFFEEYKYLFLVFIPLIGQLGIPSGSIFFLLFMGSLASDFWSLGSVFIIGTISAIVGDLIAYRLGERFAGVHIVQRYLKQDKIHRIYQEVSAYFQKKGKFTIFITRFLILTPAPFLNYILGIQGFNFRVFSRLVTLGESIYVAELLILGFVFRDTFSYLTSIISYFGIILILLYIIYRIVRAIVTHSEITELER